MDIVQTSLALFQPPPIDSTIDKEYWVEFNQVASISKNGVIEFNIPGTSADYINLAKSKLHIKYKISKEHGIALKDIRGQDGLPTVDSDQI